MGHSHIPYKAPVRKTILKNNGLHCFGRTKVLAQVLFEHGLVLLPSLATREPGIFFGRGKSLGIARTRIDFHRNSFSWMVGVHFSSRGMWGHRKNCFQHASKPTEKHFLNAKSWNHPQTCFLIQCPKVFSRPKNWHRDRPLAPVPSAPRSNSSTTSETSLQPSPWHLEKSRISAAAYGDRMGYNGTFW